MKRRRYVISRLGLQRFMKDPFIHREVMGMVEDAELMGVDFDDPEIMGGFIQNVAKKIATAVRKRREARQAKNEPAPSFSVQTPQGTAALGPGGISWTGQVPSNIPIGNTGYQIAPVQQQGSIFDKIKENPALLALAGIPIVLLMMKPKRSEQK